MNEIPRYTYRNQFDSPGAYETALSGALFEILGSGMHDLPAIVDALNAKGIRSPGGGQWTESLFVAEMDRLGAGPETSPFKMP
jgi:hypothetical protein